MCQISGYGNAFPSIERFGSAILVVADGKVLLFDCGRGVVIRLAQVGVSPSQISRLFLTHLHSDHVVGIPDLWLTGWFLGRNEPLRMWGPRGTHRMTRHLAHAFASDINIRKATERLSTKGVQMEVNEIEEGSVYGDGSLVVSAFSVDHGSVKPAFGYRVDYEGRSVVISGDTRLCKNLIQHADRTDCLIHVAWCASSKNPTPPSMRTLASAEDAGRVFATVRPKLGVIYHYKEREGLRDAVRKEYQGRLAMAKDLMTICIDQTVSILKNRRS